MKREDKAWKAATEHQDKTKHSVMRCGGTWSCLNCKAGRSY